MKVSIIIPVYYNQENLLPLYEDICQRLFIHKQYEWEVVMVNDGSKDKSWEIMRQIFESDNRIKIFSLSRNFGSHAAILCGLTYSTGDCAVIKAADMQEPTEMILEMIAEWKQGYNVVLAVRNGREEGILKTSFADFYYWIVRKTALKEMPKGGFDVYLLDQKVVNVLKQLDEVNSALTGQILWSGFRTKKIYYTRKARTAGKSRWTLRKKFRLVSDTIFSFSSLPITFVTGFGILIIFVGIIWTIVVMLNKLRGNIVVSGYTTLLIFQIISIGLNIFILGILGEYIWRIFDASRKRPPFIVEDDGKGNNE